MVKKCVLAAAIGVASLTHNGKSYIAYHNDKLPTGGEFRRSVAVEEFQYGPNGAIGLITQTAEGPGANPSAECK